MKSATKGGNVKATVRSHPTTVQQIKQSDNRSYIQINQSDVSHAIGQPSGTFPFSRYRQDP